ncbi:MAG TPA: hypothetical protein VFX30_02510 [bacterium]|nr:hypothetical protein [bacterium]
MTTLLNRTGSPTPTPPSSPTPATPVITATPPAAETPGLWDHFKSYFFDNPPAPVSQPKTSGFAEKLFCGKLGIDSACSEESLEEGRALAKGFAFLFDGGKNFLAETADKAVDAGRELFSDPKGFFESLVSGPRHGGSHAAVSGGSSPYAGVRPRPRPISLTAKK